MTVGPKRLVVVLKAARGFQRRFYVMKVSIFHISVQVLSENPTIRLEYLMFFISTSRILESLTMISTHPDEYSLTSEKPASLAETTLFIHTFIYSFIHSGK